MPMKTAPHPGDLIRTEIVEVLGLNVSKAAELLKVRRATLSDLLHGKGGPDAGNGPAHRKGVRPGHEPPSPHAARPRRGETPDARARHLDQTVCPSLKARRPPQSILFHQGLRTDLSRARRHPSLIAQHHVKGR